MPELILTSNTTFEAVDLINGAFSATTGLWASGNTGAYSVVAISNSANTAFGDYSYASGSGTTANGTPSGLAFAEGELTTVSGSYGHAIGSGTTAGGSAFAGGINSVASRPYSFCFGENNNTASIYTAIVGGQQNSIVEDSTDASQHTAIFVGSGNTIRNNEWAFIGGGVSNTLESNVSGGGGVGYNSILGGRGNTIYNEDNGLFAWNAIAGGNDNQISDSAGCTILGGITGSSVSGIGPNAIRTGTTSSIVSSIGSTGQTLEHSLILAGDRNEIKNTLNTASDAFSSKDSAIIGGNRNIIDSYGASLAFAGAKHGVILGGARNRIQGGENNAIIASFNSTVGYLDGNPTTASDNSVMIASDDCVIFGTTGDDNNVMIGCNSSTISASTNTIMIASSRTLTRPCGFFGCTTPTDNQIIMGYAAAGSAAYANKTVRFNMSNGQGLLEDAINVGSPADYAEYFEWNDGNASNEDRVGYFVSLVGGKIEIGNSNILGIVSANPAVVGDSASLQWKETYLQDDFDRIIYDTYKVYEVKISGKTDDTIYIDENNNKYSYPPSPIDIMGEFYDGDDSDKEFVRTKTFPRMNPNFDKNEEYIARKDRKEWSPIGLLGKLYVKTSEQITGNKVDVDANGMAINGSSYYVLEKTKDYDGNYGIVRVLFKWL